MPTSSNLKSVVRRTRGFDSRLGTNLIPLAMIGLELSSAGGNPITRKADHLTVARIPSWDRNRSDSLAHSVVSSVFVHRASGSQERDFLIRVVARSAACHC